MGGCNIMPGRECGVGVCDIIPGRECGVGVCDIKPGRECGVCMKLCPGGSVGCV